MTFGTIPPQLSHPLCARPLACHPHLALSPHPMNYQSLLVCLLALCTLPLGSSASVLVWDRTEVRVDLDPEEVEATATYTVTKAGDKTLRISREKTSCGCTGSVNDRKILEHGQSTAIQATFNKGKRKAKTTASSTSISTASLRPSPRCTLLSIFLNSCAHNPASLLESHQQPKPAPSVSNSTKTM